MAWFHDRVAGVEPAVSPTGLTEFEPLYPFLLAEIRVHLVEAVEDLKKFHFAKGWKIRTDFVLESLISISRLRSHLGEVGYFIVCAVWMIGHFYTWECGSDSICMRPNTGCTRAVCIAAEVGGLIPAFLESIELR